MDLNAKRSCPQEVLVQTMFTYLVQTKRGKPYLLNLWMLKCLLCYKWTIQDNLPISSEGNGAKMRAVGTNKHSKEHHLPVPIISSSFFPGIETITWLAKATFCSQVDKTISPLRSNICTFTEFCKPKCFLSRKEEFSPLIGPCFQATYGTLYGSLGGEKRIKTKVNIFRFFHIGDNLKV